MMSERTVAMGSRPHGEDAPPARELAIYTMAECPGCERARELAATVAMALPALRVHVVDLAVREATKPPAVFAVPTYVLDGRVISLGNPEPEWLLARLRAVLSAEPRASLERGWAGKG